jgi:hypothetical protein
VDELHADSFISDSAWKALAGRYNTEQLLDLIFTAGQYTLVSFALNCCGVQLEEGFEGFRMRLWDKVAIVVGADDRRIGTGKLNSAQRDSIPATDFCLSPC